MPRCSETSVSALNEFWAFEAAWARLQSDEPGWTQDPVDQEFEAALIAWMKFHKAMLIGELVPKR